MAKNVSALIDELQLRLRDTGAFAITDALAMRFLSYGVGYASLAFQDTITAVNLTTERHRLVYALPETSERIVRVVRAVTADGRDLHQATLNDLNLNGPSWFRQTADRMESFTPVGKRLLVLYPAIDRVELVELWCRVIPALYTDASTDTTSAISDDLVPLALTIAETLLLIRERRFDRIKPQLELIQKYLAVPQRFDTTEPR